MSASFAVIFDMDGVIVNSNPTHKIALRQFCARYGFELSESELITKIYGRTNSNWLRNLFGDLPAEQIHRYATEKEELFRSLYASQIKPLAGLEGFLGHLRQSGVAVAIGTSAPPENVEFVLRSTGLEDFFGTVIDDTQIQNSKPHPEIYLKAAAALGKSPGECIVFEDSLSGVQAGLDAGCKVVGITTTHSPEELSACHATREDFAGLRVEWLEGLVSGNLPSYVK